MDNSAYASTAGGKLDCAQSIYTYACTRIYLWLTYLCQRREMRRNLLLMSRIRLKDPVIALISDLLLQQHPRIGTEQTNMPMYGTSWTVL